MAQYGPFPGIEIEFDLHGNPVDDANNALTLEASAKLLTDAMASVGGITDLIVISHGWNNDKKQARDLYAAFFETARKLVVARDVVVPPGRKAFVAAVLWPSARFVDASEIPGGAAGVVDADLALLEGQLGVLRAAFSGDPTAQASIDAALAAAPTIETDAIARRTFVYALDALPGVDLEEHDTISKNVSDAVANTKKSGAESDVTDLLNALGTVPAPQGAPAVDQPDDAGGASGNIFGNIKAGALSLASLFTYKTMKERAGVVGRTGLAGVLGLTRKAFPALKVHLAGHSFGARLVTSAANTPWAGADATNQAATLALLQGAFSHFGFAVNYLSLGHNGGFRDVVGKPTVSGTVVITHSSHDAAVGWAYPAASVIFGQVADGVASINPFGGMGADGAVSTPEAIFDDLGDVGHAYTPLPARIRVRNLAGDPFISGHGDITGNQVVYATLVNAFA